MPTCVIAQPVHPSGPQRMRAAGMDVIEPPGTTLDALRQVIARADAVLVRDSLPADLIDIAPNLCVIANHGTGTDKIAVAHASDLGIPVVYTPSANVQAVAEHALMLMLATARQAALADAATRKGDWRFKYEQPMISLCGKTLGIVGLGRTGRILCDMVTQALGMRVVAWSPSLPADAALPAGARRAASLDELLADADVVSLHRPLRPDTRHTLDAAALRRMKRGAIVINTSRGGLIDEAALADALRDGHLFGAGLDVFETEPLPAGAAIAGLPNAVLTPHVAGSAQEALQATASQCADQIIDVLSGRQPPHMVRPDVWTHRRLPRHPLSASPLPIDRQP
ncbi:hydroxyacid dehydrogenase [Achromobacter aloeverae]|uniref:Phosphoglycerate dehydrogenase n=1 Tax=Achromobacter aloeverae TaxID=1750518 RepID=A0A4Q1HPQ4_9BURK|nr:hydroxyacid dehydrogenase [Achromobacter aloeverae]RXN92346.1 phosphoglycerate dehydrogenase [Achromobacter aloeverae]